MALFVHIISPAFGAPGRLCLLIVAISGYLYIYFIRFHGVTVFHAFGIS